MAKVTEIVIVNIIFKFKVMVMRMSSDQDNVLGYAGYDQNHEIVIDPWSMS